MVTTQLNNKLTKKHLFETLFYKPVFNLVIFLYNVVPGHNLGIAIILLTIIIKIILLPLSKASIKSQKALQDIQPKTEEIKKKYANNKEEMGKAMLQLYKDNKVNPLSSCLPLLIQMPFLIAVFRVFRKGFENGALGLVYPFIERPEAINSMIFGGVNLSDPFIPFAFLAGLAQFWQAKMMMTKRPAVKSPGAKDENMMAIMNKQMVYFMPALTVMIGFRLPGGLTLYWLATTVLTGLQQVYIFKKKNQNNSVDKFGGDKKEVVEGEIVK